MTPDAPNLISIWLTFRYDLKFTLLRIIKRHRKLCCVSEFSICLPEFQWQSQGTHNKSNLAALLSTGSLWHLEFLIIGTDHGN